MKTTEGSNGKSRAETQDSFSVLPRPLADRGRGLKLFFAIASETCIII
jgi:hypothetical protein